jgi:hypothetical protein
MPLRVASSRAFSTSGPGNREAGDLDRPGLIAREHFGGIAGIPSIDSEWTKPFCTAQSVGGLRIRAAHKRQ